MARKQFRNAPDPIAVARSCTSQGADSSGNIGIWDESEIESVDIQAIHRKDAESELFECGLTTNCCSFPAGETNSAAALFEERFFTIYVLIQ
jgi:hypothetical protein